MPRNIIVTGASSGIGRAICEALLGEGHRVVGIARDFSKRPLDEAGFTSEVIDLSDLNALPSRLDELLRKHPEVDALVLAAGRGRFGGLEEFSHRDIRSLVDLNFTSQAYLARSFLPHLKRRGGGDLVFIGSEAALQGKQKGAVYCASKFALRGFAQALREECSASGVRVAVIQPGMVRTPFFDALDFGPGEAEENYVLPDDVARAVTLVLETRRGTVFDEIQVTPLKRVVRKKPAGEAAPPRSGEKGSKSP